MRHFSDNQAGIAHLSLLLIIVFVVGLTGFVGYNIYQDNSSSADSSELSDIMPGDSCGENGCEEPEPADRIEDQL